MFPVRRAVAAYLKVVRRRKLSSAEGTRGGEHEGEGDYSIIPLLLGGGGLGASPEEIFEFCALLCAFLMGGFKRLGPDFSRFGHKDIPFRVRNRMLDKIFFRQSHVFFFFFFFYFFPSACFFDIISSMSPQVLAKYF